MMMNPRIVSKNGKKYLITEIDQDSIQLLASTIGRSSHSERVRWAKEDYGLDANYSSNYITDFYNQLDDLAKGVE